MTAATINRVNAALAAEGLPLEIVKGDGYFWFAAAEGAPLGIEDSVASIYSAHLRAMSVEEYVAHVADGVARFNAARAPEPQAEPAKINLTPSFSQAVEMCLITLESGTLEGKRMARDELRRYGRELDRLARQAGAAFDAGDTPTSED